MSVVINAKCLWRSTLDDIRSMYIRCWSRHGCRPSKGNREAIADVLARSRNSPTQQSRSFGRQLHERPVGNALHAPRRVAAVHHEERVRICIAKEGRLELASRELFRIAQRQHINAHGRLLIGHLDPVHFASYSLWNASRIASSISPGYGSVAS